MKTLIAILLCSILLTACSGASTSRVLLEEQGYSNVEIQGYNVFACSEDDFYRYNFTATNPNGKPVKGVVCSAPLKGSTIRFFP
jgi:hypothetical protein